MRRSLFSPVARTLALLVAAVMASVAAGEKKIIVSVNARADASYKRQKLPDGTFRPEFYAIANGGLVQGTVRDNSQEDTSIPVIVKTVAEHLAKQDYHLAPDANTADLMLVLQWGDPDQHPRARKQIW